MQRVSWYLQHAENDDVISGGWRTTSGLCFSEKVDRRLRRSGDADAMYAVPWRRYVIRYRDF